MNIVSQPLISLATDSLTVFCYRSKDVSSILVYSATFSSWKHCQESHGVRK